MSDVDKHWNYLYLKKINVMEYRCDEILAKTLIEKYGYQEMKPPKYGKRIFKTSKSSRIQLYFDYINLRIIDGYQIIFSTTRLNEKNLKLLIWFLKQPKSFRQTISLEQLENYLENGHKDYKWYIDFGNKFKIPRYITKRNNQYMDFLSMP